MTNISDFQRESYRIDEQIWDSIALQPGERALFLGLANDGAWIARAVEVGIDVTAVCSDSASIARVETLGGVATRGSATMIPASENAYDVAVAMHYLHEIDPGFHTQVVSELARVARRVVIVEPSPPADALGRRIAALYARAKRDAGQFEGYQPLEYWRKVLAIVKADVWQQLITFTRVPPKQAVSETVSLVLSAMAIEAMPPRYLDELRTLAARPDAQLLPLSRIVLVGTASGEPLPKGSTERFRPNVPPPAPPAPAPVAAPRAVAPSPPPAPIAPPPAPAWTPSGFGFSADDAPELPPPPPPPAAAARPPAASYMAHAPAPPAPPAPPQAAPAAPFGAPFALADQDDPPFGGAGPADEKGGFGWSWEPPDDLASG